MTALTVERTRKEHGFTVVEMLVTLTLLAVVVGSMSKVLFETTRRAHDYAIMTHTKESARTLLDFISYDLRMAGAGMPLGQAAFTTGTASLGDAPLPILTNSDATTINLRLNESGKNTVLTTDFIASGGTSISVMSTADIAVGDTVYISDMLRGGTQALRGTVASVGGANSLTLNSGYLVSPGASFSAGSTVNRVSDVRYVSPVDASGIVRDNGEGGVTLAPNSSFTLTYFNVDGTPIALPLTATSISDELAAIAVTVRVESRRPLKSGITYAAESTQRVALRNMNLNR